MQILYKNVAPIIVEYPWWNYWTEGDAAFKLSTGLTHIIPIGENPLGSAEAQYTISSVFSDMKIIDMGNNAGSANAIQASYPVSSYPLENQIRPAGENEDGTNNASYPISTAF